MVKGAGYTIIYLSSTNSKRYELSAQGTILRRTQVIDGVKKELLYERITNLAEIEKVEFMSERWEQHGVGNEYKYIVLEQRNAEGKLTGYIKVVPKSKANVSGVIKIHVEAKRNDCMYYKRRTGK